MSDLPPPRELATTLMRIVVCRCGYQASARSDEAAFTTLTAHWIYSPMCSHLPAETKVG